MRMGKSAVLLLTVVVAIVLAFGGVTLAQPATTPSDDNQRIAKDRATSGRDNVNEIENRGPRVEAAVEALTRGTR